jgi:hypothetical protein
MKDMTHLHGLSDYLTTSPQLQTLGVWHSDYTSRPTGHTAFMPQHSVCSLCIMCNCAVCAIVHSAHIVISQLVTRSHLGAARSSSLQTASFPILISSHSAPSLPRPIVPTALGTGSAQNKANLNSVLRAIRRIVTPAVQLAGSGGS